MSYRFLLLGSVLTLGACAYATDRSIQDIKVVTPGALGAVCNMYVDGLRYKINPPQMHTITQSKEDLVVDCLAPGNRRKKVVIAPTLAPNTKANVLNAGIGLAWDAASGAMYKYPDVITVDFTSMAMKSEDLPLHDRAGLRPSGDYNLEEFKASVPSMNADKTRTQNPLVRRQVQKVSPPSYSPRVQQSSQTSAPAPDNTALQQIINGLGMSPSDEEMK